SADGGGESSHSDCKEEGSRLTSQFQNNSARCDCQRISERVLFGAWSLARCSFERFFQAAQAMSQVDTRPQRRLPKIAHAFESADRGADGECPRVEIATNLGPAQGCRNRRTGSGTNRVGRGHRLSLS